MGVVFLAHDPQLDREVAIKVIASGTSLDGDPRSRFEREAKALARISHPNVVTVYEFGYDENGCGYLVMERLHGKNLKEYVASRVNDPLDLTEKLRIVLEICNGLTAVHEQQIVHRDLKPTNIFITDKGSVRITDFGIAHIVASQYTKDGQMLGTPEFMSPEQIRGEAVDARSDLFALGTLLYWLVSGRHPFAAPNVVGVLNAITSVAPSRLPGDPALADITERALAKDPSERFASAAELACALGQVTLSSAPESSAAETSRHEATKPSSRSSRRVAVVKYVLRIGSVALPVAVAIVLIANSAFAPDSATTAIETPRPVATAPAAAEVSHGKARAVAQDTDPVSEPITSQHRRSGIYVAVDGESHLRAEALAIMRQTLRDAGVERALNPPAARFASILQLHAGTDEERMYGTVVLRNWARATLRVDHLETNRTFESVSDMTTNTVQDKRIGQAAAVRVAVTQLLSTSREFSDAMVKSK